MDSLFCMKTIASTPNPQRVVYMAMHQDYSANWIGDIFVGEEYFLTEAEYGDRIVHHLLKGGKGHFGPFEHPQITLACGYFPHSVMQQLRTHRVGVSFDVQSFRYTSDSLIQVGRSMDLERAIYLRPIGFYTARDGTKFEYTSELRNRDLAKAKQGVEWYSENLKNGMPEEQARGLVPFDYRQHFVLSCNARSLMHILDLRAKADAQLECQQFCEFLMKEFYDWMPETAHWYNQNLWAKARLSP